MIRIEKTLKYRRSKFLLLDLYTVQFIFIIFRRSKISFMLNLLTKLTKIKINIFSHQQKVYTWFYIFKSICFKDTAVLIKVLSPPYSAVETKGKSWIIVLAINPQLV